MTNLENAISPWQNLPAALGDGPWLIPLNHQRLLVITGPDGEKFLQGQVTCDIRRLAKNHLLLGAHCDHKGRMHSSFIAANTGESAIGLRLHASIAESAGDALKKYIVFSKAELKPANDYQLFAVLGKDAETVVAGSDWELPEADGHFRVAEQGVLLRHNPWYFELWLHADVAQQVCGQLAHCKSGSTELWDLAQITLGIGQVTTQTAGEFIPQMLNFQEKGGISFDKGCYTGQEVIARMHYLGKSKKHLYHAEATSADLPAPGTEIYDAEGNPAGQVVLAARNREQQLELLFVCTEQSVQTRLTLGSPDGPELMLKASPNLSQ